MISYFLFGMSYAFACVVQPGPFQAFLFSQSIKNGWKKTVPLAFAPLLSDLPVIILVIFILTNLPHEVLGALQCFGGVFLFFLAFKAYKTINNPDKSENKSAYRYDSFFKAVIVNLLNPNPYLGWSLIMGPMLIKGWYSNPENGIALLIGFYGSMVFYSAIMIVLFTAAGNLSSMINKILLYFSVIAFMFFGGYQLWSGMMIFVRTGL